MRGLLAFSALTALASSALAQDAQYQTLPVGERAIGLGGAFTGLADDPSAAFYNPAGLALLGDGALSGSLTVNAFDRYVVERGYGSGVGTRDFVHSMQPSFPVFVSVVKKFGRRDENGDRRHAFAISTFHPHTRRLEFDVSLLNDATSVDESLTLRHEDNVRWYGPSYAFRVTPDFAIGISGFLSTRSYSHTEDQTVITRGERGDDGVFANPTLSLRESKFTFDAQHFVVRVGTLYAIDDHFTVGAMFQPPGLHFAGSGRVFERRTFADLIADPGYATFFRADRDDLDVQSAIPWELRIGGSYRPSPDFATSLDVSVTGPAGSSSAPIQVVPELEPDEETGESPQPGDFVVQTTHLLPVVNVAAGAEALLFDTIPLRVGFFTNFSPAPSIEGPTNSYDYDHVDTFGASMSLGVRTDGYDINLGAAAVLGEGQGYRSNPSPGDGGVFESYLPTDVSMSTIYIFITGHKAALSRAAREVYREYLR